MDHLFEDCFSLIYIDISNFNTLKVIEYQDIFEGISKNGEIIFNSSIFNNEILEYFPIDWKYTDIGNNSFNLINIL